MNTVTRPEKKIAANNTNWLLTNDGGWLLGTMLYEQIYYRKLRLSTAYTPTKPYLSSIL